MHRQFLSQAPPPLDTRLVVLTEPDQHMVLADLPRFQRESITVSITRQHVLHIIADTWEGEGGHFERRVAFGRDSVLACARAEFDGSQLRVVVPRRQMPVTLYSKKIQYMPPTAV